MYANLDLFGLMLPFPFHSSEFKFAILPTRMPLAPAAKNWQIGGDPHNLHLDKERSSLINMIHYTSECQSK